MGKIIKGYEQIKVNEHMEISSLAKKRVANFKIYEMLFSVYCHFHCIVWSHIVKYDNSKCF